MTSTDTSQITPQQQAKVDAIQAAIAGRTFYGSDYRHAARLIQGMRHVRYDRYTAKDDASQAKVDTLAHAMAVIFEADAAVYPQAVPFSADYFLAGTQLPAKPAYAAAGSDPDTIDAEYDESGSEAAGTN